MISFSRIAAVFIKELVQMRRDRPTFAIMIMVPVMQLALFGFAINTDPRHLPAAVELRDEGPLTRSLLASLRQSTYVEITDIVHSDEEGEELLRSGKVNFLIVIPENFESDFVRGERPAILVAADASDPVAASGVIGALNEIARRAFEPELDRLPWRLRGGAPPYNVVIHRQYNPEGVTAFNIVPGLLGVILTMTMTMITSIALTRERERGTYEALLSSPLRPLEIMIGKTTPYIFVGAIQTAIILLASRFVFHIPFAGDLGAFLLITCVFILTNLMLGYLISTAAKTQMQAMQMTFFVLLPSIFLSGFMFPFRAMPGWARALGEALPNTHFLRMVREIMLKEASFADIAGDLGPLLLILFVLALIALLRFQRTLD